jgi:DNA-binding HxlR family transcriptional regulator
MVNCRSEAHGSLPPELVAMQQVVDASTATIATERHSRAHASETSDSYGCPVARTAQIMGNKWTPLIVRDLATGQRRFSELERSLIGISPKTLSERLKRLEEARVIERRCFAEVPPRVEYSLTDKGHALLPVIESMRAFGLHWLPDEDCEDALPAGECATGI